MRTRCLVLVSTGVELEGNEREAGLRFSSWTKWLNLQNKKATVQWPPLKSEIWIRRMYGLMVLNASAASSLDCQWWRIWYCHLEMHWGFIDDFEGSYQSHNWWSIICIRIHSFAGISFRPAELLWLNKTTQVWEAASMYILSLYRPFPARNPLPVY